jgi:hypothetical protein
MIVITVDNLPNHRVRNGQGPHFGVIVLSRGTGSTTTWLEGAQG